MSCPLSTLGKHRRAPLPGGRHAPKRGEPEPQPAKHQAALLNEFLSPELKDPLTADGRHTSRSKAMWKMSPGSGSDLSDSALVSTMMQRVGLLERTVHRQALDIQQKEKKIAVLEEQLKLLRSPAEEAGAPQRVQELERSCCTLQEQVWQMEQFLGDYGMVWVGSAGDSGLASPQEEEVSHGPVASVIAPFFVDFDLVLHRVRELNVLAGEGECHVEVTQGGARLARHSPVPLALYSNGIVMFEGPFRPYEEPSTQQCILDLMDGYFPSELQGRFPDGVSFQVFDRRHEAFQERLQWAVFPGKGHVVGGVKGCSLDAIGPVLETQPQRGCSRRTAHFLNRLPESIMRAGQVMEGSSAAPQSSVVTLVDTPAQQASNSRTALSCDITTLRLRSEDGQNVFVLHMLPSDTIGQVRRYLDAHRAQRDASYDIMSAFPQRRYDDDDETLAACGLTQNTTLLLRTRPHQR